MRGASSSESAACLSSRTSKACAYGGSERPADNQMAICYISSRPPPASLTRNCATGSPACSREDECVERSGAGPRFRDLPADGAGEFPLCHPRRASQSNHSLVADSPHVLSGHAIPPTVPLVVLKVDPVARLVRVAAGAHDEAARAQQDGPAACREPEQHVNRVACETVITQAPG
jgi:hypothetical protein